MFNFSQEYQNLAHIQRAIVSDLINDLLQKNLIKDNDNLLDIGCGTGYVAQKLLELNNKINTSFKIYQVDKSEEMCNFARKYSKFTFQHDILKPMYFLLNTKFDICISSMCFQWLNGQIDIALKNIKQHMKEGGTVIYTIPTKGSLIEIEDSFKEAGFKSPLINFNEIQSKSFSQAIKFDYIKQYKENLDLDNSTNKTIHIIKALKKFNKIGAKNPNYSEILTPKKIRKIEEIFYKHKFLTWNIGFKILKITF